jgi:heat shock protein HslJ
MAAAVAFAIVATGCSGAPVATPALQIEGVTWRAVEVDGQPTIPGLQPTVAFDGDHLSGFGGCNSFSGAVAIADGVVEVGEIRATLKTCDGPGGEAEVQFMRALVSASTVAPADGGQLLIDGSGGAIRLEPNTDG